MRAAGTDSPAAGDALGRFNLTITDEMNDLLTRAAACEALPLVRTSAKALTDAAVAALWVDRMRTRAVLQEVRTQIEFHLSHGQVPWRLVATSCEAMR